MQVPSSGRGWVQGAARQRQNSGPGDRGVPCPVSAPQFPVCESMCQGPDGAGPHLPQWLPFLRVTLAKSLHLRLRFLGKKIGIILEPTSEVLWRGLIRLTPTARSKRNLSSTASTMAAICPRVMCWGPNRVRRRVLAVRPWSGRFICLRLVFLPENSSGEDRRPCTGRVLSMAP